MSNVIPLRSDAPAPTRPDWPEAENIREAFLVAAMALMYTSGENRRRLIEESPLWAVVPSDPLPVPNVHLGGRVFTLWQIFDLVEPLNEPLPAGALAFFTLWQRFSRTPDAAPPPTYRIAAGYLKDELTHWLASEEPHGTA